MSNFIHYKGYVGSVEFSEEDSLLFGKVLGIRALISYEGASTAELIADFHGAVDDYLATCPVPEKPYKGSFNVRITPELHREAAVTAMKAGTTLNAFVEGAIRQALSHPAQ